MRYRRPARNLQSRRRKKNAKYTKRLESESDIGTSAMRMDNRERHHLRDGRNQGRFLGRGVNELSHVHRHVIYPVEER